MSLLKKLNPVAFFVALCLGLLLCYITNPPPQIILKYPQVDDKIYKRKDGSQYRLVLKQVECKDDDDITEMREQILES